MLSGHYHAGQVNFLLFKLPLLVSKYVFGSYFLKGLHLYVTSGIGGTFLRGALGSYIRFLARPEIIKFDFKKI